LFTFSVFADTPPANEYAAVDAIFANNCLDCHAAQDPDGKFVLESFDTLMQGGEMGKAVVPGKSADSLLVQMIEGRFEKDGKKKIMPPGKRKKLLPADITVIKNWIDAGAHGPPAGTKITKELVVPKIAPTVPPRMPVVALAYAREPRLIAAGTFGEVELRAAADNTVVRKLTGLHGNVNALVFSPDGKYLFAAAGQPGVSGEVREWQVADGALVRSLEGHKDAIYSAALSPDGKILATGSYDQKIKLWDADTGKEIRTLSGHNGAVYGLAFRPDGKILASASGDRTVKLWDIATGERRETLSQSLKELYAVAFSRDGKHLVAGGVDNRIRVWEISENAAETTNPLLDAKFAHEGAILNLVFSADGNLLLSSAEDNTVKVWDAQNLKEKILLEVQPDWARALTFAADDKTIAVGRMDGSLGFYDAATGKKISALGAQLAPSHSPAVAVKAN
jgi:WD40 repeat protein